MAIIVTSSSPIKEESIITAKYMAVGGKKEVYTPAGRIDILLEKEKKLVEIKRGYEWKYGVGQLLRMTMSMRHLAPAA